MNDSEEEERNLLLPPRQRPRSGKVADEPGSAHLDKSENAVNGDQAANAVPELHTQGEHVVHFKGEVDESGLSRKERYQSSLQRQATTVLLSTRVRATTLVANAFVFSAGKAWRAVVFVLLFRRFSFPKKVHDLGKLWFVTCVNVVVIVFVMGCCFWWLVRLKKSLKKWSRPERLARLDSLKRVLVLKSSIQMVEMVHRWGLAYNLGLTLDFALRQSLPNSVAWKAAYFFVLLFFVVMLVGALHTCSKRMKPDLANDFSKVGISSFNFFLAFAFVTLMDQVLGDSFKYTTSHENILHMWVYVLVVSTWFGLTIFIMHMYVTSRAHKVMSACVTQLGSHAVSVVNSATSTAIRSMHTRLATAETPEQEAHEEGLDEGSGDEGDARQSSAGAAEEANKEEEVSRETLGHKMKDMYSTIATVICMYSTYNALHESIVALFYDRSKPHVGSLPIAAGAVLLCLSLLVAVLGGILVDWIVTRNLQRLHDKLDQTESEGSAHWAKLGAGRILEAWFNFLESIMGLSLAYLLGKSLHSFVSSLWMSLVALLPPTPVQRMLMVALSVLYAVLVTVFAVQLAMYFSEYEYYKNAKAKEDANQTERNQSVMASAF